MRGHLANKFLNHTPPPMLEIDHRIDHLNTQIEHPERVFVP